MKLLVVFLAIVACALGANIRENRSNGLRDGLVKQGIVHSRDRRQHDIGTRIVGGEAGNVYQLSYMMHMIDLAGFLCGGCIISQTRSLTSAYCTQWHDQGYRISVVAGTNSTVSGGQQVLVDQYHNHPDYNSHTYENDIAVLIHQSLDFTNQFISAISLPQHGVEIPEGTIGRLSGWGAAYEDQAIETFLRTVELPTAPRQQCNAGFGGSITEGMFCVGRTQGGAGPCYGDVGGPFDINRVVHGIFSWSYGCARAGYPAVFTRVSFYRNWIETYL